MAVPDIGGAARALAFERIHFVASPVPLAEAALERLTARHGQSPIERAEVIVALGGDGLMLSTLHATRGIPVYGMNRGTVGFLMNEYAEEGLVSRLAAAEEAVINPLRMRAAAADGTIVEALAINEVSILRAGPQAAKLRILVDGRERMAELVADGVHLHPAVLRTAFAAKPGRSILVTDAMAAAGGPDGDYRLGPMAIEVRDGVARLADGSSTGAIAGSTLTMDAAIRFAVGAGLPLLDVVRAASTTPAAAWGLSEVGAIEAGRRADLVVLDDRLEVVRVMRAGAWVDR